MKELPSQLEDSFPTVHSGTTFCEQADQNEHREAQVTEAIVGFDSAWGVKNNGAISFAVFDEDNLQTLSLPQLADFPDAARIINMLRRECDYVLVAIDQPIIVPNPNGSRPVDLVVRSFMGQIRSAAQSASRNKDAMFGDDAPVWGFISRIGPPQYAGWTTDFPENHVFVNFEAARDEAGQTHLIEVYPALALPTLEPALMLRAEAARYNPERPNFSLDDWELVCGAVGDWGNRLGLQSLAEWAGEMVWPWDTLEWPVKRHQDKIDAALCLIIALQWRRQIPDIHVVGDIDTGYIVTPTSLGTRGILEAACNQRDVNFC